MAATGTSATTTGLRHRATSARPGQEHDDGHAEAGGDEHGRVPARHPQAGGGRDRHAEPDDDGQRGPPRERAHGSALGATPSQR